MLTSIKTNAFSGDKSKELAMMYFRVAVILYSFFLDLLQHYNF